MSLPAFATLEDLEARSTGEVDPSRAQAALDDASALIRGEAGTDWLTEVGALDPDTPGVVKAVCCRAAMRSLRNPEQHESQTTGPFSVRYRDVYLTRDERRQVRAAAGRSTIGTLATSRGPLETGRSVGYDGPPLGDW